MNAASSAQNTEPVERVSKMPKENQFTKIGATVVIGLITLVMSYVFTTVNAHEKFIASHTAEISNLAESIKALTSEMRERFKEVRSDIKESRK